MIFQTLVSLKHSIYPRVYSNISKTRSRIHWNFKIPIWGRDR